MPLISRNLTVNGKRTSIRLEDHMWTAFVEIAEREKMTTHQLATEVFYRQLDGVTFTASMRVFIMLYYKAAATDRGHHLVGHGNLKHRLNKIPMTHNEKKHSMKLSEHAYKD